MVIGSVMLNVDVLHLVVDLMRIESESESVARMVMMLHHRKRSRSLHDSSRILVELIVPLWTVVSFDLLTGY